MLLHAVAFLALVTTLALAFNIDTSNPIIFDGPTSSFFGFSVALHESQGKIWALVGAPRANVSAVPSLKEPGSLYKCDVSKRHRRCHPIIVDSQGNSAVNTLRLRYKETRDEQWLGVALDNRSGQNGSIVVCGHRWRDTKYRNHYMMNGVCYETDLNGNRVHKWLPLVERKKQIIGGYMYNYKLGLAGMAVHYVQDGVSLLIGAPGVYDFTGAVVHYRYGVKRVDQPPKSTPLDTYVGYSVTSGRYLSDRVYYSVAGAPRWQNKGKIFIFKADFVILVEKEGSELGAFFGAAVCTVDLNSDGLDDILVGAPLHAGSSVDEGRVFVYISKDLGRFEDNTVLMGNRQRSARFGSAISSVGDLNVDGFPDVLIGAPYEDDGRGAAYVYLGLKEGIMSSYAQRVAARELRMTLRGFGASISRGMDSDDNKYPDVAIGAYGSDSIVLLRSKPVIDLDVTLQIEPKHINLSRSNCENEGRMATCIGITVKFLYRGKSIPDNIGIIYKLVADVNKTVRQRAVIKTAKGQVHSVTRKRNLQKNIIDSKNQFKVIIKDNIRDIITPIVFMVNYTLQDEVTDCSLCATLNALKPTSATTKATFERECGLDDVCTTDLKVTAEMISPSERDYVILGEKQTSELLITVLNKGEPSYMTDVSVRLPADVKFIGAQRVFGRTDVVCNPSMKLTSVENDQNLNSTDVLCDVGNPMRPRSRVIFKLRLDTEHVRPHVESLVIEIGVTTRSDEIENFLDDNKVVLRIPVLREATFALMGVSKPEQAVHRRLSGNATDDGGLVITHFYDVRNNGPGLLPYSVLEVAVPLYLYTENKLLDVIQVVSDDNGGEQITCTYERTWRPTVHDVITGNSRQFPDGYTPQDNTSDGANNMFYPRMGSVMVYQKLETLTIDCTKAVCTRVTCDLGHVQPGDSIIVRLQFKVRLAALNGIQNINGIDIVTEATVFSQNENAGDHLHSKSTKVVTHFYSAVPVKTGDFPLWLIGASAAGGLLLFIIMAAVLFRCGFFRRKQKEELQRLLNESAAQLNEDYDQDSDSEADGIAGTRAQNWTRPGAGAMHHGIRNPSDSVWTSAPYDDSLATEESPWVYRDDTDRLPSESRTPTRRFVNGGHNSGGAASPWIYGAVPGGGNGHAIPVNNGHNGAHSFCHTHT